MNDFIERIENVRQRLGSRLLILGHHYMSDDVFARCDLGGDSFLLSSLAAQNERAEAIVFCGVHFMAESADILVNQAANVAKRGGKRIPVMLPDLEAGCPMADMASAEQVTECLAELGECFDLAELTPVTYVNSSAALKAVCGRHDGIACTSSNAAAVLRWALARRERVLFVPDQHLGRNTALALGIPPESIVLWKRGEKLGGNSVETLRKAKIILWDGYCCVHQVFRKEHIEELRREYPNITILVHPECPQEIVQLADASGSTSFMIEQVETSAPGTAWAIGTEWHMTERLIRRFPDKTILNLGLQPSICETMNRITLAKLCHLLEQYAAGTPINIITVPDSIAPDALICLNRMLQVK